MWAWAKAAILAVVFAVVAAPLAHAYRTGPEEEYGRVVQSVNLALADQIWSMPHPSLVVADPAVARAALAAWAQDSAFALAAQHRQLAAAGDPPRTRDRDRRAAMRAQAEALSRFMTAFALMLDQIEYYAAASPQTLEEQQAWFADAYYDARTLALRVQKDLAYAQAALAEDPLVAASLLVLAHSTDIQLELSRAAHNRAHRSFLNATDMAARLTAAAESMRAALVLARAELPNNRAEYAIAWQDCLDHEALIAQAALDLAQDLRNGRDDGFSGASQNMDRLLALYRDRPTRTTSFAMTFTL